VGVAIPFPHKRVQALGQFFLVSEVDDAQPLALEKAESLLDLIHPRAGHRRMMELEAGMLFQPGFDQFALVHLQVVQHHVNGGDRSIEFPIEEVQQLDELDLAFALSGGVIDLAGAEGLPGSGSKVLALRVRGCRLVFSSTLNTRSCGPRGRL
jgi:hypothetical protein